MLYMRTMTCSICGETDVLYEENHLQYEVNQMFYMRRMTCSTDVLYEENDMFNMRRTRCSI